jgi:hypothetical protein
LAVSEVYACAHYGIVAFYRRESLRAHGLFRSDEGCNFTFPWEGYPDEKKGVILLMLMALANLWICLST